MAKATNTVFVIRGTEGHASIVRAFRAGEGEIKTPAKAAKSFLSEVAGDPSHELYEALMDGELSTVSGHVRPVALEARPTVTL